MKIAIATAMMLEDWMKPNACTKIMSLQCKMKNGLLLHHDIISIFLNDLL